MSHNKALKTFLFLLKGKSKIETVKKQNTHLSLHVAERDSERKRNSIYQFLNRYWRRTLGLQVRYADCGGYRFCYSYRGKPGFRPSILMLHGFSAHKDTWLTMVKVT